MEVLWSRGGLGSGEAGLLAEGHPGGNLSESTILRGLSSSWTVEELYTVSVIKCLPSQVVTS